MDTGRRSIGSAILLGGFIAGSIDIGAAALINMVGPIVILHAIASGILGRASFVAGAPSAILGLALQWTMSLVIAAAYVAGSLYLPILVRRWIWGGLGYGVVIFFVMNYVIVPLSAAMSRPHLPHFTPAHFVENMLAMLLFGVIVAFFARRSASSPALEHARAASG